MHADDKCHPVEIFHSWDAHGQNFQQAMVEISLQIT